MSGKVTRKVTVEGNRRLPIEGQTTAPLSAEAQKKKSVFERLGTPGSALEEKCRRFLRDGDCPFGKNCKYSHDTGQDGKMSGKFIKVHKEDHSEEDHQEQNANPEKKKVSFTVKRKFTEHPSVLEKFRVDKDVMKRLKKEKKKEKEKEKEKEKVVEPPVVIHSKVSRPSLGDEQIIEKIEHIRKIEFKGEIKKKQKSEEKENKKKEEESPVRKKHRKKKQEHLGSDEDSDRPSHSKKKKKKEKVKHSDSTSESDDQREKKKKKKEKHKGKEVESVAAHVESHKKKPKPHEPEYDSRNEEEVVRKKKKVKKNHREADEEMSSDGEMIADNSNKEYAKDKLKRHQRPPASPSAERGRDTTPSHERGRDYAEEDYKRKRKAKGQKTPSPGKGRRTPSPVKGRRTPSPVKGRRTPSPVKGRRTPSPGKGRHREKERTKRSVSWSLSPAGERKEHESSGFSDSEFDSFSDGEQGSEEDGKHRKKERYRDDYYESSDKRKYRRERKDDKYPDTRVVRRKPEGSFDKDYSRELRDGREERRRERSGDTHGRDASTHSPHTPHKSAPRDGPRDGSRDASYEGWSRDHYDNRQYGNQYTTGTGPPSYGRGGRGGRGRGAYRGGAYDSRGRGMDDRQGYRAYHPGEQRYGAGGGGYRGGRDGYGYPHGHVGERRGYNAGEDQYQAQDNRPREYKDYYQQRGGYQQGNREGHKHRAENAEEDYDRELDAAQRESRSRKRYRSPKASDEENEADGDKQPKKKRPRKETDRLIPTEKEASSERKHRKEKEEKDFESESEDEVSSSEDDESEKQRKKKEKTKRRPSKERYEDAAESDKRGHRDEREPEDNRSSRKNRKRDHRGYYDEKNFADEDMDPRSRRKRGREQSPVKKDESDKIEDRRLKQLKNSDRVDTTSEISDGGFSTPERSDSARGTGEMQSDSARGNGRNTPQDVLDVNLDDVYETISDDELDFFDDENEYDDAAKSTKPASLEEIDWSALATLTAPSKEDLTDETTSCRARHTAGAVFSKIGFSTNLLSETVLEQIRQKCIESNKELGTGQLSSNINELNGIGSLVANNLRKRELRIRLFSNLGPCHTALSMRKDIALRKDLRKPSNRLGLYTSLFCNAPTAPVDRELFAASVALYRKQPSGNEDSIVRFIPSKVGSIIECKT